MDTARSIIRFRYGPRLVYFCDQISSNDTAGEIGLSDRSPLSAESFFTLITTIACIGGRWVTAHNYTDTRRTRH